MLNRGSGGRYATSVFFEKFNDFDVYIEDTAEGYAKIFSTLLGRAMSSHISIQHVFPLGSRLEVISCARRELESPRERKSVFIVDGDLYLLCGEFEELPRNVVRLPRYCIENFLLDPDAFLRILDEENTRYDRPDLQALLDYEKWLQRLLIGLKPLFLAFAVAHGLRSGIKTVSHGSGSVCKNNFAEVDCCKALTMHDFVTSALRATYGDERVTSEITLAESRIDCNECFATTYISAKDYLLPLLIVRLRAIAPTKASNLSIKMRLAMGCSVEPLKEVVMNISQIVGRSDMLTTP